MKDSSGWKYDNNSAYYPFTPRATSILVAAIDYSAGTITSLEGESGTVNGITKGYADGNLIFYADMWNGSRNDGESWITGDAFTPSEATKYYDFNGQRIAMRRMGTSVDGELTYLHGDHLGSASLATNASGSVVSEMRYYAYGETRSGSMATDRQYTGQRRKTGLGLYDYNARYYDPALGRFIQADTIVPEPGNPQSLNRYAYTLNNPLRYTDPSGNFSEEQIMEYFGVGTWDEVLRLFEKGQMAGYWGWLEVLRQADSGTSILFWADARSAFEFADIEGALFERDGQLIFNGINQKTGERWFIDGKTAGRLTELSGAYQVNNHFLGAGQKYYHHRYDSSKVDWVGAAFDAGGIVADLLTMGVGSKFVNAVEVGSTASKVTDLAGLAWDWGPAAVASAQRQASLVDVTGLFLDVAGMVSPVPIWADAVSLVVTLSQGYC